MPQNNSNEFLVDLQNVQLPYQINSHFFSGVLHVSMTIYVFFPPKIFENLIFIFKENTSKKYIYMHMYIYIHI